MTTALVTQTNPYKDSTPSIPAGNSSGNASDFSKVFEKSASGDNNKTIEDAKETTKNQTDSTNDVNETKRTSKTDTSSDKSVDDVTEKEDVSNKEPAVEETTDTSDEVSEEIDVDVDVDEVMEEAIKKAEEMMLAIQNVLNIPIEDIENALQELQMTPEDLLNPDNIQKVVLTLQGTDELSLMTDEQLFADVKELMNESVKQLNALSEEMDITPEDMKQLLEQMKTPDKEVMISKNDTVVQRPIEQNVQDLPETVEVKTDKEMTKQGENGAEQKGNGEFNFSQTVIEQLKNAVTKTRDAQPLSYTSATTQSIMDQVSEMLKVTIKEDMTEMELQLHPASLGNVRVQVASKEGVITASFTTQNETVKAALESQIMILKDNLNEQGIKVEAVEVTVSSHAFERNLNEEGEHSSEETQAKKKSVRKINLSDISGEMEDGILEQEDEIVADMMRKNGNSIDYTA